MRKSQITILGLAAGLFLQPMAWSQTPDVWTRIGGPAGDGLWSTVEEWQDNSANGFAPSTTLPGSDSRVSIRSDRFVDLDVDATVYQLWLTHSDLVGSGSLTLNTDGTTLEVLDSIKVGLDTNPALGMLNLTTGTLRQSGSLAINSNSTLNIDGGRLLVDTSEQVKAMTGIGTVEMSSGHFQVKTGARYDMDAALFSISGGTMEVDATFTVGRDNASEFRVVGGAASIHIKGLLALNEPNPHGIFRFVLNETGVSAIEVERLLLSHANLIIDGTDYTGGSAYITLFRVSDSFPRGGMLSDDNISIIGFDSAWDVSIIQNYGAAGEGGDVVLSIVP